MYALDHTAIATPIGLVLLEGDDDHLTAIHFASAGQPCTPNAKAPREAAAQITAWFAGRLTRFDVPLTPARSPRGAALRQAIVAIEYGDTASYGRIARMIASSARGGSGVRAQSLPAHRPMPPRAPGGRRARPLFGWQRPGHETLAASLRGSGEKPR